MRAGRTNRQGDQTLAESTGQTAKTIHRLLEFDPATGDFKKKPAASAHRRSVRAGRGFDGRCRARPSIAAGRAVQCLRDPGGRRRSASFGWPRYPEPGVVEHTTKLVEIDQLIVETAVKSALAEKTVVRETVEGESWLYLTALHRAEVGLAQSVHRIGSASPHPMPKIDVEKAIAWVEDKLANQTRCRATGSHPTGVPTEDAGRHGRAGRRQDHARPQHFGNLPSEEDEMRAGGTHRPGGQTHGRNHRPDGQDHPPASWSSTRPPATSSETSSTRSPAIYSCWTKFRWSMSFWAINFCGPFPPMPAWSWLATWISFPRSALAPSWPI